MNLLTLAPTAAIASPLTGGLLILSGTPRNLAVQVNFGYGSGGTSIDVWLQTSLDSGKTWTDIANFHLTTSSSRKAINLNAQTPQATQIALTDGAMTTNTAQDGLLGPQFRCKYQSSGVYAGTTLTVDVQADLIKATP